MAPDLARDDEAGQMMVLAAVLLVIGLIALAGMVARVNQLGSQTAVESNQAIVGELTPLTDAIEAGVANLKAGRSVSAVTATAGNPVISGATGASTFTAADVGQSVAGQGIPAGARVTAYGSTGTGASLVTHLTLSAAPTVNGPITVTVGGFALTPASSPTLQSAIVAMLEQLQGIEASHGFVMDYELRCVDPTQPTTGQVIAHLTDGTIWIETRSTARFTTSSCAQSASCPTPAGGSPIFACG